LAIGLAFRNTWTGQAGSGTSKFNVGGKEPCFTASKLAINSGMPLPANRVPMAGITDQTGTASRKSRARRAPRKRRV